MFIYNWEKRYDRDLTDLYEWVGHIDFKYPPLSDLLVNFKKFADADERILATLKLLNKKLLTFNISTLTYSVLRDNKRETVGLDSLCTAEKLFLACRMAVDLEQKIIVSHELSELAQPAIEDFMKQFITSPYIDLCPVDMKTEMVFRKVFDDYDKMDNRD
ncbi:MAG: hypothetical protein IJX63_06435 [Lachnospiraceae bacterium]|nr:hypothetical protein [Lachnospiraceae bacterium]